MIAAAYPSLSTAIGSWLAFGLVLAFFAALIVSFICSEIAELSLRRTVLVVVLVVVLMLALAAAGVALLHHAAWIDYRRGAQ